MLLTMAVRRRWLYLFAATMIIVITMSLAGRDLLTGYSYWLDEILSVSASMSPWRDLFSNYVLSADVNPPLYLSLLKVWVGVLGDSEVATRLLSFIFAGIALLTLAYEACRTMQLRWLVSLLLLGLSPAFAYFSQETRTYSMSLALATLVTVAALRIRDAHLAERVPGTRVWVVAYYFACLALSLSHYFGWIYVFVLVVINYFERLVEPVRWKSLFLLAIISIWPAFYVMVSDIGGKVGEGSRSVRPFIGTVRDYLNGCMPALSIEVPPYQYLVAWGLLAAVVLISLGRPDRLRVFLTSSGIRLGRSIEDSSYLLRVIGVFLVIVALVNLRTPMSLSRYYIVLLPATIILVSNALVGLAKSEENRYALRSVAAFILLVVLSYSLGVQSYKDVTVKTTPAQNWRRLIEVVSSSGVCSPSCLVIGSHGLHPYYFEKHNFDLHRLVDLSRPVAPGRPEPSLEEQAREASRFPGVPILGFHHAKEVLPMLLDENNVCLQPVQWRPDTAFIILPVNHIAIGQKGLKNLSACG